MHVQLSTREIEFRPHKYYADAYRGNGTMAWHMLCRNREIEPKDLPQAWKTDWENGIQDFGMSAQSGTHSLWEIEPRALGVFIDMNWENGKPGPHMCMDWENGGQVIVQVD